jgi:enoyl-CoA hydratase/carnithine racemase
VETTTDVLLSINRRHAVLTLCRPNARNAIRLRTLDALEASLDAVAADATILAVVLAAEGPAFCAGVDLHEAGRVAGAGADEQRGFVERLQDLTRRLRSLPQASIAAIDGPAVGLGAELAVACDVRFAGARASFTFPELGLGLFPTNGVTALLAGLVGAGRAHELLLGGEPIAARTAGEVGLARRVGGLAATAALAFAERIADADADAVRLAVRALRAPDDEAVEAALRREAAGALALSGRPAALSGDRRGEQLRRAGEGGVAAGDDHADPGARADVD